MLKLENITKSFARRGRVLDKLEMTVNEGDSIVVTGPSGSGKTTLMNIISLLDHPDSGDMQFQGKSLLSFDSDESSLYRNKNLGFVFQDHLLFPHLTIKENILLPVFANPVTKTGLNEKESYCNELMQRVGISDLAGKYPFQVSGGEAQRATLVRALINRPILLLADEPTGSLDSGNADVLGDLLVEMNRDLNLTLIVATHSADLASKMKTHLKLENGRLVK
jgi:lipoprotein-releasing system ATP-binding protein